MRLWTVHPECLDAKGLVALWREGLLAKAVLGGQTRGYRNHPQLIRFGTHSHPGEAICEYLHCVLAEARKRGYHFDAGKLPPQNSAVDPIEESQGQLDYEWQHLLNKLEIRDRARFLQLSEWPKPKPHPLFNIVPGVIKPWEKILN